MTSTRSVLFALAIALGGSACMAHGSGSMHATSSGSYVVYQEPPAPRVETVTVRPGHVWVRGRWDWRGNQWTWVDGHWERERSGYAWSEGRWERRGSSWHWVEGRWTAGGRVDVGGGQPYDTSGAQGGTVVTGGSHSTGHGHGHGHGGGGVVVSGGVRGTVDTSGSQGGTVVTSGANPMYPTQAPPPPRTESFGSARSGFVWVTGRWDWRGGQWTWVDGHWERERANSVWIPGRWELQGNYYVWIEGRCVTLNHQQQPTGPVIRDHR
ncbi:MAG: hypothetical protein M3619_24840 [Myxococcota bacterium]|nr:hypothetical protein [Myxococcota bacterium]